MKDKKLGFRAWQRKYGKNISDSLDEIAWRKYYFSKASTEEVEVK